MTTIQQSRSERIEQIAAQTWSSTRIFGGIFAALGGALRGLGELRAATLPADRVGGEISELFARAVCEGSNSAMDWLYYAEQLHNPTERRYCVERALLIDSSCADVVAQLRRFG